jgi:hypothetical protein
MSRRCVETSRHNRADRCAHRGAAGVPAGLRIAARRLDMFPLILKRASGYNDEMRHAAHGYEPTREQAMAAFAKSWRGRVTRPFVNASHRRG